MAGSVSISLLPIGTASYPEEALFTKDSQDTLVSGFAGDFRAFQTTFGSVNVSNILRCVFWLLINFGI